MTVTEQADRPHHFAYLDPPYFGLCGRYDHNHPDNGRPFDARCWDDLDTHRLLIEWACDTYPDGWALSLSSTHLRAILPLTPDDVRVCAWVKPWCSYKPGVNPAYAWEPVLLRGGRKRGRDVLTVRDYAIGTPEEWPPVVVANVSMEKGIVGAKPHDFSFAVFDWLGVTAADRLDDVFTGSGAVGLALEAFLHRPTYPPGSLFDLEE